MTRTQRRALLVLVVLSTTALAVGCGSDATSELARLVDALCACEDDDCRERVLDQLARL